MPGTEIFGGSVCGVDTGSAGLNGGGLGLASRVPGASCFGGFGGLLRDAMCSGWSCALITAIFDLASPLWTPLGYLATKSRKAFMLLLLTPSHTWSSILARASAVCGLPGCLFR